MSESSTHSSLFLRLKASPQDEAAWREFVARYGRLIYAWARDRGLSLPDCEDVRQKVLVRLVVVLRTFEYDPEKSFRGLVCVMTQHAVNDLLDERRRKPSASGSEAVFDLLNSVEAREDLGRRLEEEYAREIFEEACRVVQREVKPTVWQLFWLTVPTGLGGGGLSVSEAAKQKSVPAARVYQSRHQAVARLKEQIRRLGGDEETLEGR
jgi:RNA polymerase sigma factor (sigma-70 family)